MQRKVICDRFGERDLLQQVWKMAHFAKSKVQRFQETRTHSSLGPGDYDPRQLHSHGRGAAVSMAFTSKRTWSPPHRDESAILSSIEGATKAERPGTNATVRARRNTLSAAPPSSARASRLPLVEAEQQAKLLRWSEAERRTLEAELTSLRAREVRGKPGAGISEVNDSQRFAAHSGRFPGR